MPFRAHPRAMAKEGEVSDVQFRATFSLLPHVLKLCRTLSTGQTDPQATQKTVLELQVQLQHCHHLLGACPYLDHTPDEHRNLLEERRKQLREKCDLLLQYKGLAAVSQGVPR